MLVWGQVLIIASVIIYISSRRSYIPPPLPSLPTVKIVAIIPAYNEEGKVGKVVEETKKYVDAVIVVDDGSEDRTAEEAATYGAIVIRHKTNQGYGAAVKTLMRAAIATNARYVILLDADGQHDPHDIPKFVETLEKGYEIVIGNRFKLSKIPVIRKIGILLIKLILRVLGVSIGDPENGFRAFSIDCIRKLEPLLNETWMGISSQTVYIAAKKKFKIAEVPVTVRYEPGTSTENSVKHGISIIWTLLWTWLTWSPRRALLLAFTAMAASLILLNYTIVLFNISRYIRLLYTALSIYLGILGTILMSIAIAEWILEIDRRKIIS